MVSSFSKTSFRCAQPNAKSVQKQNQLRPGRLHLSDAPKSLTQHRFTDLRAMLGAELRNQVIIVRMIPGLAPNTNTLASTNTNTNIR